jgi:hypothetical protein
VQLSQKLLRKTFPSLFEKFDNLKFEEKIDWNDISPILMMHDMITALHNMLTQQKNSY